MQAAISQYTDDLAPSLCEEDSDEWLNVDATDFEAILEKTLQQGSGKEGATDAMAVDGVADDEDRIAKLQAERLRDLAYKVQDFIEVEGDVEGARFAE